MAHHTNPNALAQNPNLALPNFNQLIPPHQQWPIPQPQMNALRQRVADRAGAQLNPQDPPWYLPHRDRHAVPPPPIPAGWQRRATPPGQAPWSIPPVLVAGQLGVPPNYRRPTSATVDQREINTFLTLLGAAMERGV